MKIVTKALIASLLCAGLAACSSSSASASTTAASTSNSASGKKEVKIGMIQYVQHDALDKASAGFKDALKEAGYIAGENLTIDEQNAQGDVSNCETIANTLVNEGVDLIFANATPAAQAVAAKTSSIPIVITSVTDPETSGLVASNTAPGNNVTGTSDLTPVEQQIDLLLQLVPDAKKIGIMYNNSEDNSIFQADIAKKTAEDKGLETQEFTVSDSSQIQSVAESMIGKVDAVYIPTDNLLAEGMANVAQVTNANGLPVIVGEEGMCANGGLATYGIDYYNLGFKSGQMAVKILEGADPSGMAIEYLPSEDCRLSINSASADELGIVIPDDIKAKADLIG
ncbi:MAG: ABC transporter substrate-binding protein [Erysipelotrichia bacterium]|nr:ABC transporter substrate-binding protein [Erysipelotrichia bacterium]